MHRLFASCRWATFLRICGMAAWLAARARAGEWTPLVGMDRQLFPSYLVSTATLKEEEDADADAHEMVLGDPYGFIGAAFSGYPREATYKLVVRANPFLEESSFEQKAHEGLEEGEIYPTLTWKFDALLRHRQVQPLTLVMELFVNGRSQGAKSTTVTVRSLNDCPLFVSELDEDGKPLDDGTGEDLSWMFAAYVNENHPWIDELTREALEAGIVKQFDGYQSGDRDAVLRQVFAIWNVLQRRGMKYSDISTESAESPVVFSQHVRLFDEAIRATQANCVDGTVLFASVLRKIGLRPELILVPGHCFLAVDLDEEGTEQIGLETTRMGESDLKRHDARKVSAQLREQYKNRDSWAAFTAAVEEGSAQLEEADDKLADEDEIEYQRISVADARRIGILPLAYKKP